MFVIAVDICVFYTVLALFMIFYALMWCALYFRSLNLHFLDCFFGLLIPC